MADDGVSPIRRVAPHNISFKELSYTVPVASTGYYSGIVAKVKGNEPQPKTILQKLSGDVKAGELTCLMGPSGAGKSSLMNILAGANTQHVTGYVGINGTLRTDLEEFRKISTYIMQDDKLLAVLSVQEQMTYAANLKLPGTVSAIDKQNRIEKVLTDLGLLDTLPTRTERLSGGQRKRLAVALELINVPPILFLDEPTSGLDSSSCEKVMNLLKKMAAEEGRTILCTIHQPSAKIFDLIDHLYMLVPHNNAGRCMFSGPARLVAPFLLNYRLRCPPYHNPSDFIMEVAMGETYGDKVIGDLVADWISGRARLTMRTLLTRKRNAELLWGDDCVVDNRGKGWTTPQLEVATPPAPATRRKVLVAVARTRNYPISFLDQFFVLFKRTFLATWRNKELTLIRLLTHISTALLIGVLYWRIGNQAEDVSNNAASLFFHMLFITFGSMMPTVLAFPMELSIFQREHLNHWYSIVSYFMAKSFADVPFQIFFPTLYGIIVYLMTDQPLDMFRCLLFIGFLIANSFIAQSIGLLVGAMFPAEISVYIGPTIIIPLLLFAGFFVTFDRMPELLRYFSYSSFVRYAFSGIMNAIYGYDRGQLEFPEDILRSDCLQCVNITAIPPVCLKPTPTKLLENFQLEGVPNEPQYAAVILFCIFVFIRIIAFITLRWKIHSQR